MIRPATEADIPAIVEMSRRFYVTTSYSAFAAMDDDTVAALSAWLINDGVLLVADAGNGPMGMVGLAITPFMFNRDVTTAHEVIWWVSPEAQGAGVGRQLLEAVAPACKAKGAIAVQMMHLANSPPQAGELYRRLGYDLSEVSYTKEL